MGTITGVSKVDKYGNTLFKVLYDDGDHEEILFPELLEVLVKNEKSQYNLRLKRHPLCMWLAKHNSTVSMVFNCNNNVQYVLSAYIAKYASKPTNEINSSAACAAGAVVRKIQRLQTTEANTGTTPTAFSKGLRLLHSGWHAYSSNAVIGAQRAAMFLLGHGSHAMSHDFVSTGVSNAIRYLESENQMMLISNFGSSVPTFLDYIYRPTELNRHCYLGFMSLYKRCKLPKRSAAAQNKDNETAKYLHKCQKILRRYPEEFIDSMDYDDLKTLVKKCGLQYRPSVALSPGIFCFYFIIVILYLKLYIFCACNLLSQQSQNGQMTLKRFWLTCSFS